MQAVILAAGKGSRLGRADDLPKCMTTVAGMTIIERQITLLRKTGVGQILVAVGYQKEFLMNFISERFDGIDFVENPDFGSTNTIYSLYLAFPRLSEDFFYLNGDVVFAGTLLQRLVDESSTGLAVEIKKCGDEEVKVKLAGSRIIAISKKVPLEDSAGEFIGIALFRKDVHSAFYGSLKREVEEKRNLRDYFEGALDPITADIHLTAVDITGEPVVEIDFPEDLETARNLEGLSS